MKTAEPGLRPGCREVARPLAPVRHALAFGPEGSALGIEFRILGPLEVLKDGEAVQLGTRMQRALLAALLLRANEVTSTDRLIEDLWPSEPPPTAS